MTEVMDTHVSWCIPWPEDKSFHDPQCPNRTKHPVARFWLCFPTCRCTGHNLVRRVLQQSCFGWRSGSFLVFDSLNFARTISLSTDSEWYGDYLVSRKALNVAKSPKCKVAKDPHFLELRRCKQQHSNCSELGCLVWPEQIDHTNSIVQVCALRCSMTIGPVK